MGLKVYYEPIEDDYEYRQDLIVEHDGVEILRERDGGEPEDNSFIRDWSWIKGIIEKVYKLGCDDSIPTG